VLTAYIPFILPSKRGLEPCISK